MASLELKPEHGYVFLVAGALAVTHLVIGGIVSGARKAAFNKAYKERPEVKALEEEHKKAFPGQKFCPDGAPPSLLWLVLAPAHSCSLLLQATRTWGRASSASCCPTR